MTGELLAGNVYRAGGVVIEPTDDRPRLSRGGRRSAPAPIVHQAAAHRRRRAAGLAATVQRSRASDVPVDDRRSRACSQAGEAGKRIAVIGAAREVGTAADGDRARARAGARRRVSCWSTSRSTRRTCRAIASDPVRRASPIWCAARRRSAQIITRDRYSRVHLVQAGEAAGDAERSSIPHG